MRLSNELRLELEERLSTIEREREADPAYRDLPVIDAWAFKLQVVACIVAIFLL
ncbi:MAG: hypothetical protein ACREUQ_15565 [Burkholderiales bacterium]